MKCQICGKPLIEAHICERPVPVWYVVAIACLTASARRPHGVRLAFAVVLLLTGCGAALPVVVASSYVAGQTIAAYSPDSIERKGP